MFRKSTATTTTMTASPPVASGRTNIFSTSLRIRIIHQVIFILQFCEILSLTFQFHGNTHAETIPIITCRHGTERRRRRRQTTSLFTTTSYSKGPRPIDPTYWPDKFPAKSHCSKCGLCETSYVTHVKEACPFLGQGMRRNIDGLESMVHGRIRNLDDMVWTDNYLNNNRRKNSTKAKTKTSTSGSGSGNASEITFAEEARFGVLYRPMILARGNGISNAQWTGCVTGIAISMLEEGMVDAVICIATQEDEGRNNDGTEWCNPEPILARSISDVLRGRGVKPALAPSLRVLEELKESKDVKRLLFCGVGCAVQAFRAIQHELNLEEVYVLGTNCADNSPTSADAQNFLRRCVPNITMEKKDTKILGYEFMQDFRVHVKYYDGMDATISSYERKPYFCLPGDVAEFAIAPSCQSCFDYTNALADVVVGYMAAPLESNSNMEQSYQCVTVRNSRGEKMIQSALKAGKLELGPNATGSGTHERFAMATVSSDNLVQKMIGGKLKTHGMPRFVGEIVASVMTAIGPKGVSFARYSIDYHVLRNYLHCLDVWGEETTHQMLPKYCADIVNYYLEACMEFREIVKLLKIKKSMV